MNQRKAASRNWLCASRVFFLFFSLFRIGERYPRSPYENGPVAHNNNSAIGVPFWALLSQNSWQLVSWGTTRQKVREGCEERTSFAPSFFRVAPHPTERLEEALKIRSYELSPGFHSVSVNRWLPSYSDKDDLTEFDSLGPCLGNLDISSTSEKRPITFPEPLFF